MMVVPLLVIFSLIIIMYFVWKIKDRKKKWEVDRHNGAVDS